MEITRLYARRYKATLPDEDPASFFESRVSAPLDVYEEFNRQAAHDTNVNDMFPHEADGQVQVNQPFLYIDTTEDITGIVGPIDETTAQLALQLEEFLVGRDPRQTRKLWDLLYRKQLHGRKGRTMMAISAIDIALWDLNGKYYDAPIYELLGGPTRDELDTYASMYLYSIGPDDARATASQIADDGYEAQKWFLRYGPGDDRGGMRQNEALAAALREATTDDYHLMFDAWCAWDRTYALEMIERLAPYKPTWLEEPVHPDNIDQLATISDAAAFPIAGGEHAYTRWGFHDLLKQDALDVLQPDTLWAGGISELDAICTLASIHDRPVNPHGLSVPANIQVIAAQSPQTCPYVEYLTRLNEGLQYFFTDPITPDDGVITVPDRPGLGISIDHSKVDEETTISP